MAGETSHITGMKSKDLSIRLTSVFSWAASALVTTPELQAAKQLTSGRPPYACTRYWPQT